jgi:hypothetical protein
MKTLQLSMPSRFRFVFSAAILLTLLVAPMTNIKAGGERQIASVVQRGNFAYVYDEKGSQFLTLPAGDGVTGYTASTVSIRRGNFIYIYNAKGSQVSTIPAGR